MPYSAEPKTQIISFVAQLEEAAILAQWDNQMYDEAMQWNWQNFEDDLTKREFAKITDIGTAVLEEDDLNRVSILYVGDSFRYIILKEKDWM